MSEQLTETKASSDMAKDLASQEAAETKSAETMVLALPKGRILKAIRPILKAAGIEPVMVLNKYDLVDTHDTCNTSSPSLAYHYFKQYQALGFTCLTASTKVNNGLDLLQQALQSHSAMFAGQSGVGKSSLINALMGHNQAKVGGLSEQTGLGTHTTVMAELYPISSGGYLIDSPGIREFSFASLSADDITAGFPEMADRMGQCKFRNCAHLNEPGCALKTAVEHGEVSAERFQHYLKLRAIDTLFPQTN